MVVVGYTFVCSSGLVSYILFLRVDEPSYSLTFHLLCNVTYSLMYNLCYCVAVSYVS